MPKECAGYLLSLGSVRREQAQDGTVGTLSWPWLCVTPGCWHFSHGRCPGNHPSQTLSRSVQDSPRSRTSLPLAMEKCRAGNDSWLVTDASVHGYGDGGVLSQCRALSCSYPHPNYLSGKQKTPNKFRFTLVWSLRSVFTNIFLHNQIYSCLGNLVVFKPTELCVELGKSNFPFHLLCRNESNSFSVLAWARSRGMQSCCPAPTELHPLLSKIRDAKKKLLLEKSHFLSFRQSLTSHSSWRGLHVQNNGSRRPPRATSHLSAEQGWEMWIFQQPFRDSVTAGRLRPSPPTEDSPCRAELSSEL